MDLHQRWPSPVPQSGHGVSRPLSQDTAIFYFNPTFRIIVLDIWYEIGVFQMLVVLCHFCFYYRFIFKILFF